MEEEIIDATTEEGKQQWKEREERDAAEAKAAKAAERSTRTEDPE